MRNINTGCLKRSNMARILNRAIEHIIKRIEHILSSDANISTVVDDAFKRLGKASELYYNVQDNILALGRMLRSWVKRDYRDVSPRAIITAIAALVYFTNPFDLIPDFIPVLGQLDDIVILGFLLKVLNKEIERFLTWEAGQQGKSETTG